MSLIFDDTKYEIRTLNLDGQALTFRAFEHIPYCETPAFPELEKLSVYVPEDYYRGKSMNGYDLHTAPIFMPNTVGGYLPGPEEAPGLNNRGDINASFYALLHGYIVVSAGARGRGNRNDKGENVGIAPAGIVDLKAAVRFLRHNKEHIPGDVEKIITNGTSAGGAMSALQGCTGNHPDYEPYLKEIGAADERDDVFASSCYCPITDLDHADMAYEWEFGGRDEYYMAKMNELDRAALDQIKEAVKGHRNPAKIGADAAVMTGFQMELSEELKRQFPAYLNSLGLKSTDGSKMHLNDDGTGSFRDLLAQHIAESAGKAMKEGIDVFADPEVSDFLTIEKGDAGRSSGDGNSEAGKTEAPEEAASVTEQGVGIIRADWEKFVDYRTRMKSAPAFDDVQMRTPECELFGSKEIIRRHFTDFSAEHDRNGGAMAEKEQIRLMNPMNYIDDPLAVKAKHFRIRHGAADRDTSLAISEILALKLQNAGIDAEVFHPWGVPHSGDYDLQELFAWIDSIILGSSCTTVKFMRNADK